MLKLPLVGEALPTSTRGLHGEFSMQASSLSPWLFAMALSYYFITIDYFNFHLHNNVICIKRQGNYCRFCIWIFDDSFDQSKWSVTKKIHGLFHIHFHHKFHPICTMECKIIISELGFDKGHSRRWETVNIRKGRCVSAKLIIYYVLQCQHNRHQRSKPNTWKSWLAKVKAFGHNFFNQKFDQNISLFHVLRREYLHFWFWLV